MYRIQELRGWEFSVSKKASFDTRSPLKAKPLRYPGQSLDQEIDRIFHDEILLWLVWVILTAYVCIMEWIRWITGDRFHPLFLSFLAIGVVLYSLRKFFVARKKIRALKLGRDGERVVGQYLDELREKGYRVFHDLIGDNFNVDHVVISPTGVFTIETKTFSKPMKGEATIRVNNGVLTVNGHGTERDLLKQAKAQARWVNSILRESTGKNYPVKPVIVFPGWYVEPLPKNENRDVWVLNPKVLPSFIGNEPETLERQDVMLATYHLSRHIRTTN